MIITLYQFSTKIHTTLSYDEGEIKLDFTDSNNGNIKNPQTKQGEILQIGCIIEPENKELRTDSKFDVDSSTSAIK